jgi:hypothetical protein
MAYKNKGSGWPNENARHAAVAMGLYYVPGIVDAMKNICETGRRGKNGELNFKKVITVATDYKDDATYMANQSNENYLFKLQDQPNTESPLIKLVQVAVHESGLKFMSEYCVV